MEITSPPMTAMASGCSICEPEPSASASGSMPLTAAMCGHEDGPEAALRGHHHGFAGVVAFGAIALVGVEQQDAVLGDDADDHDEAHESGDVESGAGEQQRTDDAAIESTDEVRIAVGRGEVAELREQHAEDQHQRQHEHAQRDRGRTSAAPDRCRRTRRGRWAEGASPAHAACTCFTAVPRSEPSRRAVTVTSCCRFSRRISFCGGSCVMVVMEPSEAVGRRRELKTVFRMVSSEARLVAETNANRCRGGRCR